MTPFPGFFSLSLALASDRIPRRLGNGFEAVLLDHLSCDSVNLHLGYHVALPCSARPEPQTELLRPLPDTSTPDCAGRSMLARPFGATRKPLQVHFGSSIIFRTLSNSDCGIRCGKESS
jgi:hypothetical protein